jgi:hypothetical protein
LRRGLLGAGLIGEREQRNGEQGAREWRDAVHEKASLGNSNVPDRHARRDQQRRAGRGRTRTRYGDPFEREWVLAKTRRILERATYLDLSGTTAAATRTWKA